MNMTKARTENNKRNGKKTCFIKVHLLGFKTSQKQKKEMKKEKIQR